MSHILSLFSISLSIPIIARHPSFQQEWFTKFWDIGGCWTESIQSTTDTACIDCLEISQQRNYPHVFIFENNIDIQYLFSPEILEKISDTIEKHPNWKLLYFHDFSFFIVREISYSEAIQYFNDFRQSIPPTSLLNLKTPSQIPTEWYSVCELKTVQNPVIPLIEQSTIKHNFSFAKPSPTINQNTSLNSSIARALSIGPRRIEKQKSLGFINTKQK